MPTYPVQSIPTQSWDELLTTTLRNYRPQMEDNIFDKTPLLEFLKDNAQTRDGGYTLAFPIELDKAFGSDLGFYELYDTLTVTEDNQGFDTAEYRWFQHAASVAISGLEEAINRGKSQLINLVEAKVKQMEKTIADEWNAAFYDSSPANLAFHSLPEIVDDGNPTRNNLGGIDATTDTAWQANVDDTTEALGITTMSKMFNDCSQQRSQPDRIFTTQTLWEKYESLLQPQLRYSDAKVADAGFQNLLFKNKPVVWDPDCNSGEVYFLTKDSLYLVKHSDVWLKSGKWIEREDKDARYTKILSYGNLVCVRRQANGVLKNKS